MNTIRWGIIGCGDVTEVKSGPALQQAKGSALVAVMRRNGDLARDYALRHGVPRWYDTAGDLIADPEVDAVYVATPPSTHLVYTLSAAAAGKPVYVEKPMATSFGECQEMIKACRDAGVKLFVAYYRRALPRFLKIREMLSEGRIGQVRSVSIRFYQKPLDIDLQGDGHWRVDKAIAGCGYFCDLASHKIDLLQYFLGDIVDARGVCSNQAGLYPVEDTVSAAFRFENGICGAGSWCFSACDKMDETIITGTRGWIRYPTFEHIPIEIESESGNSSFQIVHPKHIQQPLIQTVVDELLGHGQCPSTGESAANTNRVMDRILGRHSQ